MLLSGSAKKGAGRRPDRGQPHVVLPFVGRRNQQRRMFFWLLVSERLRDSGRGAHDRIGCCAAHRSEHLSIRTPSSAPTIVQPKNEKGSLHSGTRLRSSARDRRYLRQCRSVLSVA